MHLRMGTSCAYRLIAQKTGAAPFGAAPEKLWAFVLACSVKPDQLDQLCWIS